MNPLQEKILNVLRCFDAVCRENGLTYFLLGGTMLGAVRHQGFIPWDDDADVGLPRADYERLLSLPDGKIPQGFRLRHFSKERGVPYAFARMEDENTTCLEARRSGNGYVGGVYIDVFPLDFDGHDEKDKQKRCRAVNRYKKLLYTHIAERSAVAAWKRPLFCVLRCVTNEERLVRRLDHMVRSKAEGCLSNYLGHWGVKESIPYEVFYGNDEAKKGNIYIFEGYEFYGAADADAYLTSLYGDYRVPEPLNLRRGHTIRHLDLNQSYHKLGGRQ